MDRLCTGGGSPSPRRGASSGEPAARKEHGPPGSPLALVRESGLAEKPDRTALSSSAASSDPNGSTTVAPSDAAHRPQTAAEPWQEEVASLRGTVATIHRLIQTARDSPDFAIELDNPHLVRCWEVKGCSNTSCPCCGRPALRCWQVVGTHCGGVIQGVFAQKLERCEACEVYRQATATPSLSVAEAFNNMLHLIHLEQAELLRARRAAEQGARAKSAFLAAMSHELRTPMNGVLGVAELLAATELTAEQREYATLISQSGEGLLGLLDHVLELSMLEAGMLELGRRDFDPVATVKSAIEPFTAKAREKGLGLAFHVQPGAPRRLCGDPARLEQILANLVDNAIKFTDSGAVVVNVSLQEKTACDATLCFEVSDTGIGVAADRIEEIFKPFVQADSSMSRRFGGAGLGLTISSHLAEMMGGTVSVESTPGRGSRFRFTVKLTSPEG